MYPGISNKYKEQIKSNKKIYTIDNGYIGSKAFRFTPNIGVLYENIVAVELKRRELKGQLELYYYKNAQRTKNAHFLTQTHKINFGEQSLSYAKKNPEGFRLPGLLSIRS